MIQVFYEYIRTILGAENLLEQQPFLLLDPVVASMQMPNVAEAAPLRDPDCCSGIGMHPRFERPSHVSGKGLNPLDHARAYS